MDKEFYVNNPIPSNYSPSTLRLLDVHKKNAGFTEYCASKCLNKSGESSYQWLVNVINQEKHTQILDLACGSGLLLELCCKKFDQKIFLSGVDMSKEELKIARVRLTGKNVMLHEGFAQNLNFFPNDKFDVVLCHWALTLMDPIHPVIREIKRVIKPDGVFAAITDGNHDLSKQYTEIHNCIYKFCRVGQKKGSCFNLGDVRTRSADSLKNLMKNILINPKIEIESDVVVLEDTPKTLSKVVSGFFYASFFTSNKNKKKMLAELETIFHQSQNSNGISKFEMPINKVSVKNF